MTKKLILVRHAKSSWADTTIKDFDRPLNKRGIRDAPIMAKELYQKVPKIDCLVSSTANRAKLTAQRFIDHYDQEDHSLDLSYTDALYHASAHQILEVVQGIENKYNSCILFGHNPGFTYFADYIDAQGIENVPTCGITSFNFDVDDWKNISPNNGRMEFFIYPKMFIS